MFVVEKIFDLEDGFVCQSVFVASTEEKAQDYVDSRPEDEQFRYRLVQHTLDEWPESDGEIVPPEILREMIQQNVEDTLKEMMDKGIVDQLVGEDGHFYYGLTPEGKKIAEDEFGKKYDE